MSFLDFLKNQLKNPTPLEVISKELAQAHLDRLEAEGAVEYSSAVCVITLLR